MCIVNLMYNYSIVNVNLVINHELSDCSNKVHRTLIIQNIFAFTKSQLANKCNLESVCTEWKVSMGKIETSILVFYRLLDTKRCYKIISVLPNPLYNPNPSPNVYIGRLEIIRTDLENIFYYKSHSIIAIFFRSVKYCTIFLCRRHPRMLTGTIARK